MMPLYQSFKKNVKWFAFESIQHTVVKPASSESVNPGNRFRLEMRLLHQVPINLGSCPDSRFPRMQALLQSFAPFEHSRSQSLQ